MNAELVVKRRGVAIYVQGDRLKAQHDGCSTIIIWDYNKEQWYCPNCTEAISNRLGMTTSSVLDTWRYSSEGKLEFWVSSWLDVAPDQIIIEVS